MVVWKNIRVVNIGMPTKRSSPLRFRHHQRRHRHFGDVEFGEAQLPPEQFGRMQDGGNEVDAVRLHRSSMIGQVRGLEVMPMLS